MAPICIKFISVVEIESSKSRYVSMHLMGVLWSENDEGIKSKLGIIEYFGGFNVFFMGMDYH